MHATNKENIALCNRLLSSDAFGGVRSLIDEPTFYTRAIYKSIHSKIILTLLISIKKSSKKKILKHFLSVCMTIFPIICIIYLLHLFLCYILFSFLVLICINFNEFMICISYSPMLRKSLDVSDICSMPLVVFDETEEVLQCSDV